MPYGDALALQERQIEARRTGEDGDVVLLLEHPPVVTLGRSACPENLLASPEQLSSRGVELFEISRGGDVTYHAPVQLIGYPIVDLAARDQRDVHAFLRALEDALIAALGRFELRAGRIAGMTGVFMLLEAAGQPERKIASIGIGVRRWITWHGFALNVSLDLSGFDAIVPCGLHGVEMTSVAAELERSGLPVPGDLDERVREAVIGALSARLG